MKSEFKSKIYAITAPSGTGKTTVNRKVAKELHSVEMSISMTTRKIRAGEKNGDHYWFVDDAEFTSNVEQGKMLEWANVHGNKYGTSFAEIQRISAKGKDVILEIDVQGWAQIQKKIPEAVSIFILPPSIELLWERLTNRGTDDLQTRYTRIQNAKKELESAHKYQNFIVNDQLEITFAQLKSVLEGKPNLKLNQKEGIRYSESLLNEFKNAQWLKEIASKI